MRAATVRRYGSPDVVQLEDLGTPIPQAGEVRVKLCAATVGSADATFRSGKPYFARLFAGLTRPKWPVLGSMFSGEVDALGADVTQFSIGEPVFGFTGPALGAHAQHLCISARGVIERAPHNIGLEEAAAVVDGTALPFLREGAALRAGQTILINGASGSVGSTAVQLARHFGAIVTAVCSAASHELVRSLGADDVIDYRNEDFTTRDRHWDVIFDVAGTSSFRSCKPRLTEHGVYLTTVPSPSILFHSNWTKRFGTKKAKVLFTGLRDTDAKRADLQLMRSLVEAGAVRPVVDTVYPLDRIAEAHWQLQRGNKRGNVLVTLR